MKLKPVALGLTLGIIWGAALFLMTWVSYWTGYGGLFMDLVVSIYPGYAVSPLGSIIGLFYGFVDAFVGGLVVAWLYNRLARD